VIECFNRVALWGGEMTWLDVRFLVSFDPRTKRVLTLQNNGIKRMVNQQEFRKAANLN